MTASAPPCPPSPSTGCRWTRRRPSPTCCAGRRPAACCCSSPPWSRWCGRTPAGRRVRDGLRDTVVGVPGLLELDLEHWASEGLLAVFFCVAGLELKREFVVGDLSDRREAVLPVAAAVAGMVVPAVFYLAVNLAAPDGRPGAGGRCRWPPTSRSRWRCSRWWASGCRRRCGRSCCRSRSSTTCWRSSSSRSFVHRADRPARARRRRRTAGRARAAAVPAGARVVGLRAARAGGLGPRARGRRARHGGRGRDRAAHARAPRPRRGGGPLPSTPST